MSETPRKRTATEAMRLRPSATGRPEPAEPTVGPSTPSGSSSANPGPLEAELDDAHDRLASALEQLDAVLELHRDGVIGMCVECLLPHPCPTYRAASAAPPSTDTPEEKSQ